MGSFLGFLWFDIKRRSPYHFPLFDLRIYHNLCFSDFDIKWFVVVLTSCVSCSACFSVSADRFSARPLTHAQYTQYPFTGQNMVKKLSYQRGGIMLSLYISLLRTHLLGTFYGVRTKNIFLPSSWYKMWKTLIFGPFWTFFPKFVTFFLIKLQTCSICHFKGLTNA